MVTVVVEEQVSSEQLSTRIVEEVKVVVSMLVENDAVMTASTHTSLPPSQNTHGLGEI